MSEASSLPLPPAHPLPEVWTNSNPPLPRGRAPRDPHAVKATYECDSIEEFQASLRAYLSDPPAEPEHASCQITLPATASLVVPDPDPNDHTVSRPANRKLPEYTPKTVLETLSPAASDAKDMMKRQRAASKICVAAVQRVDGYRYSFHNNWKSGEEDAFRFSYYCNDSLLNKDRVANGKAGSQGRRVIKPVYDCKGVLSIKFSATRQCIDVIYKHIPCHSTYEARAPPPRKDSKRRALWDLQNAHRVFGENVETSNAAEVEDDTAKPKRKRQRKTESIPKTSAESDLREQSMVSLLELIRGGKEEPQMQSTSAPTFVTPPITHVLPPRPQNKPKSNPQRERPNAPKNNTGSDSMDKTPKAAMAELSQKNEQLRLERDNTLQALQSLTQEHEKLKAQLKEAQDRMKQMENQAQQNNASVAGQLPRHSAPNAYQAHQAHQAHQAQQAQQVQQAHQMNQTNNLSSSYPQHNSDRAMNQGYSTHLTATAGGQPDSVLMLPGFAKAPSAHVNRNPLYPNPNQQQPGTAQWGGAPMQYRYQPTAPDNGLWNTQHLASQMR